MKDCTGAWHIAK